MHCEKCGKNNATTHIKTVVNGVIIEKHLCDFCAFKDGYGDFKGNNLSKILSSMFGDASEYLNESQQIRCSCCGLLFSDIAKSGKCGCPECYTTFYNQLLPYLKRVHGSIKHIGKTPNYKTLDTKQCTETVEGLRSLLNQLVSEEKYEQAAEVRDKIKKLTGDTQ